LAWDFRFFVCVNIRFAQQGDAETTRVKIPGSYHAFLLESKG